MRFVFGSSLLRDNIWIDYLFPYSALAEYYPVIKCYVLDNKLIVLFSQYT